MVDFVGYINKFGRFGGTCKLIGRLRGLDVVFSLLNNRSNVKERIGRISQATCEYTRMRKKSFQGSIELRYHHNFHENFVPSTLIW